MNTQVDVAIIGAGPTGLVLGIQLAQAGHSVAVIERAPQHYPLPRAVHYDHEISRIFQSMGMADEVSAISEPPSGYEWINARGERLLYLDWAGMGQSGWPTSSFFSQPQLEAVLAARAVRTQGLQLMRGWEAFEQQESADSVTLSLRQGAFANGGQWVALLGEAQTVTARYVVGADGANSFVRRVIGTDMVDLGFYFDWLVVDVIPKVRREWTPSAFQVCDPARPTTVVPGGPGRRRWEFMLLPGETAQQMNRADVTWKLLADWDITPDTAALERHSVYTFRALWARDWRKGRLLLAGDAAHLTPPFAGQGMCAGIRDAHALGWRLDCVLRGLAGDELLDSYGPERTPHVRTMIEFAVELGRIICVTDPQAAAERDHRMIAAAADPSLAPPPWPPARLGAGGVTRDGDPQAGLLSFQGLVERDGVQGLFDDVMGSGGRFALIGTRFDPAAALSQESRAYLSALGGVAVQVSNAGLVRDVDGAHARWFDDAGYGAVLVRPDGYVFGSAQTPAEADALVGALRQKLGHRCPDSGWARSVSNQVGSVNGQTARATERAAAVDVR